MEEKKMKVEIELPDNIADGVYSNLVIVSHSDSEFIFDFIRVMPGKPRAKVQSRIIMTPPHAKMFLQALSENIRKFEKQFGEIRAGKPRHTIGIKPENSSDEEIQ